MGIDSKQKRIKRAQGRISDAQAKIDSGVDSAGNFAKSVKRQQDLIKKLGGQIEAKEKRIAAGDIPTSEGGSPSKITKAKGVDLTPEQKARATPEAIAQSQEARPPPTSNTPLESGAALSLGAEGTPEFVGPPSPESNENESIMERLNREATALGSPEEEIGAFGVLGALSGASVIGKIATSRGGVGLFAKELPGINAATRVISNTVTAKKTVSMITRVIKVMKKPHFVVAALFGMLGTYPWAEWAQLDNAKQSANIAAAGAIKTGDPEIINKVLEMRDEIFDMTLWENIKRLTPGLNIAFGFGQGTKAAFAQKMVTDAVLKDELIKLETGETEDVKWERIRQQEVDQDKAAVDYYNDQRKLMVAYENEARRAAQKATRKAEVKARNEDAKFWAREKEKQRNLEAEDRKAIADFWTQYRKTAQQFNNDNRPSNLNFGLL